MFKRSIQSIGRMVPTLLLTVLEVFFTKESMGDRRSGLVTEMACLLAEGQQPWSA
jgi:hypothetical protein